MSKKSRIIVGIASLLLIVMYFTPIWSISLEAPQYPEGLGINIHINNILGHKPNDLQSINGLNHYIGMKTIHPDSINELKIMPYIILFFIIFGLFTALIGKKFLAYIWLGLFAIVGFIGMYDFYSWEYDYGHNLSPKAIIKLPGMTYQPPLIGSKQLLNFNATSLPNIGAIIAVISILVVIYALFLDFRKNKNVA